MSKSYSKAGVIKWIVSFAIPIIIALAPVSETFTAPIKWFSVITVFFICLIATEVLPMFVVSVAIPVTYIVFLHVDPKIAFGPWAIEVPWLILGGFIMTMALEKTGLLKRMAYRIILLCGGRFNGILFGFMILGSLTSLIITDNSAKAIMFGALAVGIGRAFDLEFGGRTASALGMVAMPPQSDLLIYGIQVAKQPGSLWHHRCSRIPCSILDRVCCTHVCSSADLCIFLHIYYCDFL